MSYNLLLKTKSTNFVQDVAEMFCNLHNYVFISVKSLK